MHRIQFTIWAEDKADSRTAHAALQSYPGEASTPTSRIVGHFMARNPAEAMLRYHCSKGDPIVERL